MPDLTTAEMEAMRPAFLEALAKSQRAADKENIVKIAGDLARNASRMKYLALAASCISGDGMPGEPERSNCVGYLLDIMEYLGGITADQGDKLDFKVREVFEGAQL